MNASQNAAGARLTKLQADTWLARLVTEGRVKKIKTTYRAVTEATQSSDQPTLF